MKAAGPLVPAMARAVRWADRTSPRFLSIADRVTADDWPGVVAYFGDDVRLVVDFDVRFFRVQRRQVRDGGVVFWDNGGGGRPAGTLAVAVRRWLRDVPELAEVVDVLPASAYDAHPAMAAASDAAAERWAAVDYRSDRYCRVVRQDTQVRLIVDQSGEFYGVQHCPAHVIEADDEPLWKTRASSRFASALVDWLAVETFEEKAQRSGAMRSERVAAMRERAEALFEGVPEVAAEGLWPSLPDFGAPLEFYPLPCRVWGG